MMNPGFFKFNNEEIRNKVISLWHVHLEGIFLVFGPLVNKYPNFEHTLDTCLVSVRISNIPRLSWNKKGLTYIPEVLSDILCNDSGFTWQIVADKYEISKYANICVEMSNTNSRLKYLLVVVLKIKGTFTHSQITIEYLDKGKDLCSLCSSPEHVEGSCPYILLFET